MISQICIFIIVFSPFGNNVYAKNAANLETEKQNPDEVQDHQEQTTQIEIIDDATEVKIKDDEQENGNKNETSIISEKLDRLTSLVEENQSQIKLLFCSTNPVKNIENKIYWIQRSSSILNYTLEGWTFGNYRTVILTIF